MPGGCSVVGVYALESADGGIPSNLVREFSRGKVGLLVGQVYSPATSNSLCAPLCSQICPPLSSGRDFCLKCRFAPGSQVSLRPAVLLLLAALPSLLTTRVQVTAAPCRWWPKARAPSLRLSPLPPTRIYLQAYDDKTFVVHSVPVVKTRECPTLSKALLASAHEVGMLC